jgi:hypothetical protein
LFGLVQVIARKAAVPGAPIEQKWIVWVTPAWLTFFYWKYPAKVVEKKGLIR